MASYCATPAAALAASGAARIGALERDMKAAAANLDFEAAAALRDRITRLKDAQLGLGTDTAGRP